MGFIYYKENTMEQLFHGTDMELAKKIQSEGFSIKPSKEHWLGNGIYFYSDYSLAKWWTTNPTNKFGTMVKEPAILKCSITKHDLKVLNLLKLEDYKLFCEDFEKYFWPKYIEAHPKEIPNYKQIRCAYCDVLKAMYDLDVIIGNFNILEQPYMPQIQNKTLETLNLRYTEIQVCVFDKNIVSIDEIERI